MEVKFALSILSTDFRKLEKEIKKVEEYIDFVHIDVMDGHFVPNISIGLPIVEAVRKITKKFLDIHLMIQNPEAHIKKFVDAGADSITIHSETCQDVEGMIEKIKSFGVKAGVAYKPNTEVEKIPKGADLILLMTVEPGFGGQKFMESVLPKISKLKKNFNGELQVDGGVNEETCVKVVKAGANNLVVGSAVTKAENPQEAIQNIRKKVMI